MSDFLHFSVSHTTPLHSLTITILLVNSFPPSPTVWITELIFIYLFLWKLDSRALTKSTSAMLATLRLFSPKLRSVYSLSLTNVYCESAGISVVEILHSLQWKIFTDSLFPHNLTGHIPSYVNQYTSITVKGKCCWNWWPYLMSLSRFRTRFGRTPSHQTSAQHHCSGKTKYIQMLIIRFT